VTWTSEASKDVAVLRRFIADNYGDIAPELKKARKLIGGQLGRLKVSAFGVGLESDFTEGAAPRELAPSLTAAIARRLVEPLKQSGWLIILDQLDESWDGSKDRKDLLVGLVKGVKRLNDQFGWSDDPVTGVRAVAFLRTDIYESLAFDDKDKLRDTVVEISWDHEQLRRMLAERVGPDVAGELFESKTSQRKGRIPKGSLNYLVSRTFMRPRDLLQLLQKLQYNDPSADRITKRLVEATEPGYSRDKVDDLRQEYRRGAPWVDDALDALKQGPNKFDSRRELEERLTERIKPTALQTYGLTVPDLVEWMTETSILGAAPRLVKTETIQFRCEGISVSLEGESTAWVHPALFQGLSLSEPRARRA
jgi:hypothetical protein